MSSCSGVQRISARVGSGTSPSSVSHLTYSVNVQSHVLIVVEFQALHQLRTFATIAIYLCNPWPKDENTLLISRLEFLLFASGA
jgi:hypothetical protein